MMVRHSVQLQVHRLSDATLINYTLSQMLPLPSRRLKCKVSLLHLRVLLRLLWLAFCLSLQLPAAAWRWTIAVDSSETALFDCKNVP